MEDKLCNIKKDLQRIASDKKRTRIEKYTDARKIVDELDEVSKKILLNEYQREYKSTDNLSDIKNMFTFFMSFVSILISVLAIYANGKIVDNASFRQLLSMLTIIIVVEIIAYVAVNNYRISRLRFISYIISLFDN